MILLLLSSAPKPGSKWDGIEYEDSSSKLRALIPGFNSSEEVLLLLVLLVLTMPLLLNAPGNPKIGGTLTSLLPEADRAPNKSAAKSSFSSPPNPPNSPTLPLIPNGCCPLIIFLGRDLILGCCCPACQIPKSPNPMLLNMSAPIPCCCIIININICISGSKSAKSSPKYAAKASAKSASPAKSPRPSLCFFLMWMLNFFFSCFFSEEATWLRL